MTDLIRKYTTLNTPRLTGEVFADVDSKICNNYATLGYYSPYFGMNDFSTDNWLGDRFSSFALLPFSRHVLVND